MSIDINIDDEMLALAEKYYSLLNNPDFSQDAVKEWDDTKRTLLVMLMAKIETEKMMQRLAS